MMPLIWGPMAINEAELRYHYGQIDNIAIQYLTESSAIEPLLPDCYRPADKPIVTVWFGDNRGVDYMGGRGYRIAAVQVAVKFDGIKDRLEGDYVLVMFENDTIPIIGGREQSGVPKIYADIPEFQIGTDGKAKCEASIWGQTLISLKTRSMKRQNALVRYAASKLINSRHWLTYKYIPSVIGPPDVEYPMIFPSEMKIEELWRGKSAELSFSDTEKFRANNFPKYWCKLVEVLNTLPMLSTTELIRFKGSSVLRADLCRRLQ
jgi:acetoacetate decarboxylase